jgi:hypothetical protein
MLYLSKNAILLRGDYSPTGAPSSVIENIPVPLTAIYAI